MVAACVVVVVGGDGAGPTGDGGDGSGEVPELAVN